MRHNTLPVCFHPTTLVMLDDDIQVFESIYLRVMTTMHFMSFACPREALDFFKTYQMDSFTKRCTHVSEEELESRDIQIDIPSIHKQLFNPNRFKEVAAMIVDFSMPYLTGTEFCEKTKHLPIQKLMLTGEATSEEGLNAFNKGLIQCFYPKGKSSLGSDLPRHIRELQIAYFQDLSSTIIQSLFDSNTPPPKGLLDHELVEPIFKALEARGIAEYYLVSNEGYFLTVTYDGKLGWFVLHSEDEINAIHELCSGFYEENPSAKTKQVLDQLQNHDITLLFLNDQDSNTDPSTWDDEYMIQTESLTTQKGNYYYGFAQYVPEKFPLDHFTSFRSTLDTEGYYAPSSPAAMHA